MVSPTTKALRDALLEQLKTDIPEFLWTPGELQVDILDTVAEFHYNRERVVELFNSMQSTKGFRRLVDDSLYREEMSGILDLSLVVRAPQNIFIGVPETITNDFDAFVFYYMDRYAERYGRKRGRGSAASGTFSMNYTPGITGTAKIVLSALGLLYTTTVTLDGSGTYNGTIFSFGYGSKFNTRAGGLSIYSVISAVLTVTDIFNFYTSDVSGGSDYQDNSSFLLNLENTLNIFSGPLSMNALSKVISDTASVDKYKLVPVSDQSRFMGSADLYLKGGVLAEKTSTKTVGSDLRVLVPYQPSTVVSITKSGAVVPPANYTVTYPASTTAYYNSVKQLVWIEFDGINVFAGDIVIVTMMVDVTVQDVYTALSAHYSVYNETARDVVVYQAIPQAVDIAYELILYRPYDEDIVKGLCTTAFLKAVNGLEIGSDLQPDDLRAALREIFYKGERLVDAVNYLYINKYVPPTHVVPTLDAVLTLSSGEYWTLGTLTQEIL
jgi:hypothetical protein